MSGGSPTPEPNAPRDLLQRVVAYLAERPGPPPPIEVVASDLGLSPKLLAALPMVRTLLQPWGVEGFLDWSLRDWLTYHYLFVHQGYRYGLPELQPTWRGRTVLKNPLDCWVHQEIIQRTQPDVLVELGVAFGGSALFYADLFELAGRGEVLAIDVSLDRVADVAHPRVTFVEGSSVDEDVVRRVRERCRGRRTMVVADSNHAEPHVLAELRAYADLVGVDMYFVVEDTLADVLDLMPVPIGGPLPAVQQFLRERTDFLQDLRVAERYLLSQSPYGYLRRVR